MTLCIGRMNGTHKDWRAELNFVEGHAVIGHRSKNTPGAFIEIATVPLGDWFPESNDYDCELCDDQQNRNLMMIVFVPEIINALRLLREEARVAESADTADAAESFLHSFLREADTILDETIVVPEPDNPDSLDEHHRLAGEKGGG